MDGGWPGEWEAPTQEIAEEARRAAEETVPPPQEQDTSCDVSMWTAPMGCNCTAHTKRGGDRKARYWHTLTGYIQSNGKPYVYNQIMVSWTLLARPRYDFSLCTSSVSHPCSSMRNFVTSLTGIHNAAPPWYVGPNRPVPSVVVNVAQTKPISTSVA